MVRLGGRLLGNLGDRNGEAGAEVDERLLIEPGGTFRLKFFAFRGRLGGDGDRRKASLYISSGMATGDRGSHSG